MKAQSILQCLWFTTLVSKQRISIPYKTLNKVNVVEIKQLMAQGQKTSRILAWTFY
jgi:23S rRNA A1618 N6-methylase RlmF